MNESVFKTILQEHSMNEWAKYENAAQHAFSKKHERRMKRTFELFEKNTRKYHVGECDSYRNHIKFSRKSILLMCLLVFLAIITGCTVAYFISNNFRGEIYDVSTKLSIIDIDNCPSVIEEKYVLSGLTDNFEIIDSFSMPISEYVCYKNKSTGDTINFTQWVKSEFDSSNYNTENNNFTEVKINDWNGLCLELIDNESYYSGVIWDVGDYILEISGNVDKNTIVNLAKTAKIVNN